MFGPWRTQPNTDLVGIETSAEGVAIARVSRGSNGPTLRACEYLSRDAAGDIDSALPETVVSLGLAKRSCNWVLGNRLYTLLLVEAPNVPADELREAMRWRIRDLISFPAEDATLDVFELPEDGSRGKKMLYVVVAEKARIQDTVDLARRARLDLQSIDVAEMALRNLAALAGEKQRGLAIVRLRPGSGNVALVREGRLYLSRHFDLDYRAGLLDDLPEETLLLEIQRSLDYYERQMGQDPPGRILFCGDNISPDKLGDNIRRGLNAEVDCLELQKLLPGADSWDEHRLQLCVAAIGGALREELA